MIARIVSISVLTLVACLGGYALGHRAALRQTLPMLAADTQFNVAQRIESLAKLRLGDTSGAIADLESVVDVGVVNTLRWRAWSDLELAAQRSMQREGIPLEVPGLVEGGAGRSPRGGTRHRGAVLQPGPAHAAGAAPPCRTSG